MNPATLTNSSFTLTGPNGAPVAGTVTTFGRSAVFDPATNLVPGDTYVAEITTGAQGNTNNALAAPFVWTFTVEPLDNTAPTVTLTDPTPGEEGVALNRKIAVTFSEAMDPATITDATFTLSGPDGLLPGTFDFLGLAATFTPNANLLANTTYTATVTTGAEDLSNNALAADFIWTFKTGTSTDTTRPTVTFTDPVNNDTGVALNKSILADFSETMDPSSVTSNFTLTGPNNATITGTVTYVGLQATFDPVGPLAANTLYTATVTTGAEDLAGNALAEDFIWTFRTGAVIDLGRPTIVSTDPEDDEMNVVSNDIKATFSESMAPASLNTVTFLVRNTDLNTAVLGTVSYNAATKTATFVPTGGLLTDTNYQATITTGAEDSTGNSLAINFVWTFKTSIVILGAIEPFGGFGGSAGMTNQGLDTVVEGDFGTTATAATSITRFRDSTGAVFMVTPANNGLVTGVIVAGGTKAQKALADARLAHTRLSGLPADVTLGDTQLGGQTFGPGVYRINGGALITQGLNLTLNGGPNDVWVFQAVTLTVGSGTQTSEVLLTGGAQSKNVYWVLSEAATINATTGLAPGVEMVGTILAESAVTFSVAGATLFNSPTLTGRAIALTASVTMVNTIINLP